MRGKCSAKNSTWGPVGNHASKLAASRRAVGPLPPIQMGGPPARCGLGSIVTSSSVKCLPLKLTWSRLHSARQISSVSRNRPTRRSHGTPAAANSRRIGGVSAAMPMPRMMRPSATRSSVPTTWASTTGLRSAGSSTPVPSRTRRVRAATAASSVSGSWRGRAVSESPIHTESKPAASARSAMASSGAVSGRPDMIASRVGSRTPNSTAMAKTHTIPSEVTMASHVIRVGNVEIMALSDGMLEFDLCNFFPTIDEDRWGPYESHLTDHKVRFNLGSYLIRSDGRTILVDTGLGPKPAETPDAPWGQLLHDFQAKGVRPEEVDMVVMTHLHRDHVGWNLKTEGKKYVPTFP